MIQSLTRECGYQTEGVDEIRLLDFDNFKGFTFEGDGLCTTGVITEMRRDGKWINVEAPEATAKYSSDRQNGVYTHSIETFIPELSGEMQARLDLAVRRRFLPIFRGKNGRYFIFGWEAGATLSFANQTDGGIGALVTIAAQSGHPLFEITAQALHYWILDTGRWDMVKLWWNDETWRWK